ncbi:MAG: 3-keto-5-aminohexanoate cleavage protein [Deltaproteobacteria bacterium]|nr:3-keto-5-aminohexanoate cleavage protein [Deltaproteobacteria bacterium]
MEKLILTAAITGAATVPSQTPYLPLTPQQIADSAIEAAEAGAAIVHIHARRPEDGMPSSDPEHFREIVTRIKEHSDVVICLTTGGSILMTVEERARVVPLFSPEMCSFNLGSINFALHTSIPRIKEFKYEWEKPYLEKSKDFVFKNTFQDFEYLCKIIRENGTKPELEIYDVGHLYNLDYLVRTKQLSFPLHLQFVMGVLGAIRATPEDLIYLKNKAESLFGKENFTWSVIGIGAAQFSLSAMAINMGGHVRVGLEDNIYIKRGVLAKSNAELVEKAVELANAFHREIATPDDARRILGLKGLDKVKF